MEQDTHSELFVYCLQLTDRHKKTNMFNKMPYVPFLNVALETFNKVEQRLFNLKNLVLEGDYIEKIQVRNTVIKVTKALVKQNYFQMRKNVTDCVRCILKKEPNRKFTVFR